MNKTDKNMDITQNIPMTIIDFDKDRNQISQQDYNMKNINLSDYQVERLAKATLDACKKFYSDPQNVKKFEEWKKEYDKRKLK